jgi:hypothetical protein
MDLLSFGWWQFHIPLRREARNADTTEAIHPWELGLRVLGGGHSSRVMLASEWLRNTYVINEQTPIFNKYAVIFLLSDALLYIAFESLWLKFGL